MATITTPMTTKTQPKPMPTVRITRPQGLGLNAIPVRSAATDLRPPDIIVEGAPTGPATGFGEEKPEPDDKQTLGHRVL